MTSYSGLKFRATSLRTKILVPFLAILIVLGSAATIGTVLIISGTLEKTADERLSAFQHQVYQEFRGLEDRLLRRANILEVSYHLDRSLDSSSLKRIDQIERLIEESLFAEGMSARFIDPSEEASLSINEKGLAKLLYLAKTSLNPQIRFRSDNSTGPAMTLVKPVIVDDRIQQYIVIQALTGYEYLNSISTPLNLKTAIYDLNGSYLTSSEKKHTFLPLNEDILSQVLNGQRVFISHDILMKHRNLFYAIPLGTTDMLIVQLEMPLADISSITSALATRSGASILIALLIGGYIYYRIISQIIAPAQEMMSATKAIGEGNLNYRIEHHSSGEFGELAASFNNMMQNISNLYDNKIENERELTKAQEELKYKEILEEKNERIEQVNSELKTHLRELSTLLQLNQAMASTLELDTLFERVINSLSELLDCHRASLLLYNAGSDKLVISHTLGIDKSLIDKVDFDLNEGVSGEAAKTRKSIYVKQISTDARYLNYKGNIDDDGSLLSIPLLSKNRLCGVLNLHKKKLHGFSSDDINLAKAVANQAAVAIENSQLYEQARSQSITDELTGLSNRRHFQDIFKREVIHAQRYSTHLSLIMIDIDHFKRYNDTHGHLQGDVALKKVADVLLQNTRGIDLAVRFGGEEFIVLLPKTTVSGARITAEKLREKIFQESFAGEEKSQPGGKMTISLGVASYPDHTGDMENLLELADRALYQAKNSGRDKIVIWNDTLNPAS